MELKTIGLTKKFGSKTAVNALNITLTNGVYGLLGANGAGKTTLMRLLCNIQTPTSGKILLNGRNIVELGEKYRNLLGYLPQHFGYYPDFSAYDFLIYVSALKGLDEKAARKKSKELLEAVDLSRESKHKIKTFSGGMKQRLGQVWECTVPTAYAEKYAAAYNTSNLRNISGNQTILRIIGDRPPMENVVRVQPTLEDLYLFYFKGGCEE